MEAWQGPRHRPQEIGGALPSRCEQGSRGGDAPMGQSAWGSFPLVYRTGGESLFPGCC